jgi:uncharacterized membrane protein
VPNSTASSALGPAAILGGVSGVRTFTAPAVLALRGRLGRGPIARAVPLLAAGELIGDKLPFIPPRSDPPSLLGRVASGTAVGGLVAGPRGAGAGAAGAAATTYASERLRAALGERLPISDPLLGLAEDALVIAVATGAAAAAGRPATPAVPATESVPSGSAAGPADDPVAPEQRPPRRALGAVARGLAAAAVGTAAMTSAQTAYLKLTGGSSSRAPEEVGQRLIRGVARRRVPRDRRDALNEGMHVLYGTSWGLPLGLLVGSLPRRPPAALLGAGLGLSAWGASLVVLPGLRISEPPWRQSPAALAADIGMHLVYGEATAAALAALGG